MSIKSTYIILPTAELQGENPLPQFCSPIQDRPLQHDGTLNAQEETLLGFQTGKRCLPYKKQDRYTRERVMRQLPAIVMENERYKATFLPSLGARLYSLYDKKYKREIFYKNDIFQPASLAQRNAWFSGGVEFNVGHYGHTPLTCDHMFAAIVRGKNNQEFLRFYEYERMSGLFYSLDFYLPKNGSLDLHARIINGENQDKPAYCWVNIAARQTAKGRVFSGVDRILYRYPRPLGAPDNLPYFSVGKMPSMEKIYAGDCSIPAKIDHSSEYFFQYSENEKHPWEASYYEDGWLFCEVSTEQLRYRKLFCWGDIQGGHHWQRFLTDGAGDYIELQAGYAPTQLHGKVLKAKSEWQFTQSFGHTFTKKKWLDDKNWSTASSEVERTVREVFPSDVLDEKHRIYTENEQNPIEQMLHIGSGWGWLEIERMQRDGIEIPKGMLFPAGSIGSAQLPWMALLDEDSFPELKADELPEAYMTGYPWWMRMEQAMKSGKQVPHWSAWFHLGVMRYENGNLNGAEEAFEQSLKKCDTALAWRCLAVCKNRKNELRDAIICMEKALDLPGAKDIAFKEEYFELLVSAREWEKLWDTYNLLPEIERTDLIRIFTAEAAVHLDQDSYLDDFFTREFAVIVEGESKQCDIWFERVARRTGRSLDEVKKTEIPPFKLDFRVNHAQLPPELKC